MGVMAVGAFAFGNRRVDYGGLKRGFLMALEAERRNILHKSYAVFFERMFFVGYRNMAGATTYIESSMPGF